MERWHQTMLKAVIPEVEDVSSCSQVHAVWPIKPPRKVNSLMAKNTLWWVDHRHRHRRPATLRTRPSNSQTGSQLSQLLHSRSTEDTSGWSRVVILKYGRWLAAAFKSCGRKRRKIPTSFHPVEPKSGERCHRVGAIENMALGVYSRPVIICTVSQELRSPSVDEQLQEETTAEARSPPPPEGLIKHTRV